MSNRNQTNASGSTISGPNYALRGVVAIVAVIGGVAYWSHYEEQQRKKAAASFSSYSSYESPRRYSEPERGGYTPPAESPPPAAPSHIQPPFERMTNSGVAPFSLGSTRADVEKAQGAPTSIDKTYGETWSYGTATVEFRNGKVFAWHSSPFLKLNVELLPKDPHKASAARARGNYSLGSTKDEVLAVQGTPDSLDRTYGETWYYGTSTVQFVNGKVHSWHGSPVGTTLMVQLTARATPAAEAAAARGFYSSKATKDEVLAVEGTPTSIDKTYGETWSYGTSTIRFRNGRIAEYYNSPVGPMLKIQSGTSAARLQGKHTSSSASPAPVQKNAGIFSVGDTSQRVLAVQGRPDQILNNSATRETWIYGTASVTFEGGKVVEYRNSGGHLRIE